MDHSKGVSDGRVLEVAVRRVEQVELEVLPRSMENPLAVDDDSHRSVPLLQADRRREAAHLAIDPSPPLASLNDVLETNPLVERNLDRVLRTPVSYTHLTLPTN